MEIKKQTGPEWIDSKGNSVEVKRITKLEKVRETEAVKIAKQAVKVETSLSVLKKMVIESTQKAYKAFLDENKVDDQEMKNHVWYNFNETIKVSVESNAVVEYNSAEMILAYDFLEKFIGENDGVLPAMLLDSLKMTRGRFDNKKIKTLLNFEEDERVVNDENFQSCIKMVKKAKTIKGYKTYEKIHLKKDEKWIPIQLQFSATEVPENEPDVIGKKFDSKGTTVFVDPLTKKKIFVENNDDVLKSDPSGKYINDGTTQK